MDIEIQGYKEIKKNFTNEILKIIFRIKTYRNDVNQNTGSAICEM